MVDSKHEIIPNFHIQKLSETNYCYRWGHSSDYKKNTAPSLTAQPLALQLTTAFIFDLGNPDSDLYSAYLWMWTLIIFKKNVLATRL